jgi:structural maintenance of chromosome 3 (chondroitin sulfate proteoglycan 6)
LFSLCLYICCTLAPFQEGVLLEEIQKIKNEIDNLAKYIEPRKSESSKFEATLAKKHSDYNDLRKQRDVLQEERKYVKFLSHSLLLFGTCIAFKFMYSAGGKCCRSYWKEESDVTAEIDRLREELMKAQKSLDHATPGVWKMLLLFHFILVI